MEWLDGDRGLEFRGPCPKGLAEYGGWRGAAGEARNWARGPGGEPLELETGREGLKPRMGAEGQRNCGERGRGVGWGGRRGCVRAAALCLSRTRSSVGSVSLCVFWVGVRGAPGLVFEWKGPEGGEQFSVVILDPGGGQAACAVLEGPGQWSAAG